MVTGLLSLLLLLRVGQVTADCEMCHSVESGTDSASFTFDSVSTTATNDSNGFSPFIRIRIDRQTLKSDQSGTLSLNINGETSEYDGCYSARRRELAKRLGDVNVTLMSRPLFNKSDKCIGFGQTSVRLARLMSDLDISDGSSIDVEFSGPSQMKEVCVGMEGGNCTIRGNGESHRRCFVRPTMEDGCELFTLHSDQTMVITTNRSDFVEYFQSDDDSIVASDYHELYVGSVKDDISLSVSNILKSTMIEVMSAELKSSKDVYLSDTSQSTVHLLGKGEQTATVSAIGNTSLFAYVSNDYRRNRIIINARCSQGLTLLSAIRGAHDGWDFTDKWSLRVGCPDDPSLHCSIQDVIGSSAKQIIAADREAWTERSIQIIGNPRRSFGSAFAAFYSSEVSTTNQECCFADLCGFEKQCQLISERRSFYYDRLCGSFVLSLYVPFVHLLLSMVYLICIWSLLMLISRDPKIQASKHIKLMFITLLDCAVFSVAWFVSFTMEAVENDDMFEDISQKRELDRFPDSLIILLTIYLYTAADMRSLHFVMIEETRIKDNKQQLMKNDDDSKDDSQTHCGIRRFKIERWMHFYGCKCAALFGALYFPNYGKNAFGDVMGLFFILSAFLMFLSTMITMISSCCFCISMPDIGVLVSWLVILWIPFVDGSRSIIMLFVFCFLFHHFWDFFLAWSLIFHFAYGEGVMTSSKKAVFLLLIQFIKLIKLFTQVLDVLTDWIIVGYFFADGSVFLGFVNALFVLSAVAVSAYFEWDSFPHCWQRVITLMGLGRIIQVIDDSVSQRTRTFLEEAEVHLESLPSVLLGMLILLTTPRENTGPILFSMSVTWFGLILRAVGSVVPPKMPAIWKGMTFVTLLSDFFVRCVSPALIIAVIQGQNGESPRLGSILFLLLYFVTVLLAYMLYYHSFYSGAVSRSPFYLRAMISTISVRCALFAYLRMDHYKHDAVIATPLDLAVLTIPHCCISLLFSSICCGLLWDVYPSLCIATVIFTLIQLGCVGGMCVLNKDGFVVTDAHQLKSRNTMSEKHRKVVSLSADVSPMED